MLNNIHIVLFLSLLQLATSLDLPKVTWYAPFLSGGGYSSEAITFAIELQNKIPFSIVQFAEHSKNTFIQGLPRSTVTTLKEMMISGSHVPPSITICHATPDVFLPNANWGWGRVAPCPPPNSLLKIARTMYETDRLPLSWVPKLNLMDKIWVPTEFHRQTFQTHGIDPSKIVVIPEAVDVEFFNPNVTPMPLNDILSSSTSTSNKSNKSNKPYIFLSVFKWEERKNWKGLLRAYFEEFTLNDNVLLILKTTPFHNDRSVNEDISEFTEFLGIGTNRNNLAPYHIFGQHLELYELPALYNAADAFVLPSRGEGWGRPHAEAMSMGLPTIATNWSGNLAFMNQTNSLLIPVEKLIDRNVHSLEGHLWAEPSNQGLKELMRKCYKEPEVVEAIGKLGRKTMVEHYNPNVVGSLIINELKKEWEEKMSSASRIEEL